MEIKLTSDEILAIIEELSHRPYRDVYQMIAILAARVKESEPTDKPKVFVPDEQEK